MLRIFLMALVILTTTVIGIRTLERRLVYFPHKFPLGDWDAGMSVLEVEDCYFQAEDGSKLHGWFAPSERADVTMLWCHGNAGNITHRLDNLIEFHSLNVNVFIFDYRGYGKSEGSPDEEGLYQDAVAAYQHLLSRDGLDPERIFIFGRSLGGAVAIELALRKKCAGLIIESAFSSVKDMAKKAVPLIPAYLLLKTKFDSISKIPKIHVPILFIHGGRDSIVPIEQGRRLFEAANEPKAFYEIPNADHNDTYTMGGDDYFERISDFLSEQIQCDR